MASQRRTVDVKKLTGLFEASELSASEVGRQLAERRLKRKPTKDEIHSRRTQFTNWLNKDTAMDWPNVVALAAIFGVPEEELLKEEATTPVPGRHASIANLAVAVAVVANDVQQLLGLVEELLQSAGRTEGVLGDLRSAVEEQRSGRGLRRDAR